MKKKTYLAGDMLNKGAQMLRAIEAEELRKIDKVELYSPQEDKSVNDKQNAVQEGLAERIFRNDTKAILDSEVIVADISQTLGTSIEMGQIWGINYMLERLDKILTNSDDASEVSTKVSALLREIPRKTVYWKTEDVRDHEHPEVGYRRSHSYNAYLIGCLLAIAGEPKTFEEIIEELQK
jgi:nucleoside 2-deoxyribosyltransferase